MCLLLSVVVPMRVDTSLLGRRSGLTRAVRNGVNVLLEAERWSAKVKAVGQGSSARWLMV